MAENEMRRRSAPASSNVATAATSDEPIPMAPTRPTLSRQNTGANAFLDSPPTFSLSSHDLFEGLSLLDLLVSIDAHFELWSRRLKQHGQKLKAHADKLLDEQRAKAAKLSERMPKVKKSDSSALLASLGGQAQAGTSDASSREDKIDKKLRELRGKARDSLKRVQTRWEEEKTVRLRDKISFFLGMHNVVVSCLLLGFRPTWIPAFYSLQVLAYMPLRVYSYKRKLYHYFLFDLCYAVNALCLFYLWVLPGNVYLFQACYGLALGSLGSAIATWRNSLVLHSLDKMISLSIHYFPPFVFTVIRHFYPVEEAHARYPALAKLPTLNKTEAITISMVAYLSWQVLYYRFVIIARKEKIAEGRATSFTYLINDRKRLIGKIAARCKPERREGYFMLGQAVYTLVTLLPPIFVLYDSKFWSAVYMATLFAVSTWNGASFYIHVFGRKFEKELMALRKEFEEQQALLSLSSSSKSSPHFDAVSDGSVPLSRSNSEWGVPGAHGEPDTRRSSLNLDRGAGGGSELGNRTTSSISDLTDEMAVE